MCHSRDFRAFDRREANLRAEERRAGTVETIMTDAKREAEKARPERAPERASAKEAAPAK